MYTQGKNYKQQILNTYFQCAKSYHMIKKNLLSNLKCLVSDVFSLTLKCSLKMLYPNLKWVEAELNSVSHLYIQIDFFDSILLYKLVT